MDTGGLNIEQWEQGGLNDISKRLVTALDAIGFSEKIRETITDHAVLHDSFYNISGPLSHGIQNWVMMGSRREGTSNYALQPDMDAILYSPLLRVFETVKFKTNCPFNTHLVTVKDSHTPIGYTKIHLVQNGRIVCSEAEITGNENGRIHHFEKFKYDTKRRLALSNEFIPYNDKMIHSKNGQAETISNQNATSVDLVRAYMFNDIPETILPWFSRSRKHGWPSKKTLKLCKRMGCFVVPVGQTESKEINLEWRFSMSFQERYLMLNLNEAQYKCYILLKLIKKFLIKPEFGDAISSYHCKTSLFYIIERSGNQSWDNQNILKNLNRCLKHLLHCVENNNCPNFFVPDENMFASKLNKYNRNGIRVYIDRLIRNECIDLLEIKFQNFGTILSIETDLREITTTMFVANEIAFAKDVHAAIQVIGKYGVSYEHAFHLDCLTHQKYSKCLDIVKSHTAVDSVDPEIYIKYHLNYENFPIFAMESICKAIQYLCCCQEEIENNINGKNLIPIGLAMRYIYYLNISTKPLFLLNEFESNKIHYNLCGEKQIVLKGIKLAMQKIFTNAANVLVVGYLQSQLPSESQEILLSSIQFFEMGKAVNYVTNRIKFARLLYIRQMYGHCRTLLNRIIFREKETIQTCICYDDQDISGNKRKGDKMKKLRKKRFSSLKGNEHNEEGCANSLVNLIANSFTNCVIYNYYELEAINAPLFYEASRSIGIPTCLKVFVDDSWFSTAVFDPVVFLHYMMIECSLKLNDRAGSAASLRILDNLLFKTHDRSLTHLETAINLVGHLYLKKGWTNLALECFRKSLTVRPFHNAVKWHIMFLLFGK